MEKLIKKSHRKCSNKPSKSAVGDPPLYYWSKSTNLKFSSWFFSFISANYSRNWWEIRSDTFIRHTGSKINVKKSKIEKCGSRSPIVLSPSSKRDFQIAIFLDLYACYDKNALNIPICALFYRLEVKLAAKNSKIENVR